MRATSETPAARLADPIAMAVINERLGALVEDIGLALIRGAFSTNIKERRDCSTGLFDAQARLVAQADHMPIHIGSLLWGVRALIETYPPDAMRPGDQFVMNDPYLAGGTHLPDISLIRPLFADGRLVFFIGNIAHHADVGGPVPGSVSGRSQSIFAEGLRIPPMRLQHAGTLDEPLLALLVSNMRGAEERALDLRTQIGANERGAQLFDELVGDLGLAALLRAAEDLIVYAGRRIRAVIDGLPDGRHRAVRHLDDDGIGDEPVRLEVEAIIEGADLTLDFSGSGNEARGAVNLSKSSLEATVAYAMKALLDPQVPSNSGLIEACRIVTRPGTIVDPVPPAAVAARAVTSNRLAGAIFEALGQALPEARRMASSNDSTSLVAIAAQGWVYPESIGGGGGAFANEDGADAIHVHTVNSTNLPIEMLEHAYPLRCTRYALVPDSGGAGRQRGGLGIARAIELLAPAAVTVRSDGHRFPAPGLMGGLAGSMTRILRNGTAPVPSRASLEMQAGETLVIETLGGGGFGDPGERAAEALAADLLDGRVSEAEALRLYGEALFLKASSIAASGG